MSRPAPPRSPIALAFLAAGALLIALALLADRARPAGGAEDLPALVLLAPAPGDTVTGAVRIRFRTAVPLDAGPMGWSAGALHPHVLLDGREYMAAAGDIERSGPEYVWTIPLAGPGAHTLLLTWAGADHRLRGDTTGRTIRLFAR